MARGEELKRAAESALLRTRLITSIAFLEGAQDFPGGKELKRIVEDLAARGDVRALRLVQKEVDAMALTLAPYQREGLEALLKSRTGADKEAERLEQRKRAEIAVRRGRIASEKERRHLEDYLEMLDAIGADPSEGEDVRRLLESS